MELSRMLYVLGLAISVAGCAVPQQPKIDLLSKFDKEHAERLLSEGKNTIKGSALMRQVGGGVVTCAGQAVSLIPATAYATERMTHLYRTDTGGTRPASVLQMNREPFSNTNPEYYAATRRGMCDAQGFFKFDKVADGDFYITTVIRWKSNPNSPMYEGGAMMRKVSVANGETKEIVIAP
jgi:hypothetical protein